jgi:hypothetical protein
MASPALTTLAFESAAAATAAICSFVIADAVDG